VQAQVEAEIQQAQARASQAGPLAQAQASQDVIAEQTALAEREAALTEKRLESEVRRPADPEAYEQRTLAEAGRDTTKLSTEAEAFKQRALAEAARDTTLFHTEAEAKRLTAINARAGALSGDNQPLIAANKLVDMLPALVQASAHGIEGAHLTILNGSNGVNDVASGIAAQGLSIYHALQSALRASPRTNGTTPTPEGTEAKEALAARQPPTSTSAAGAS
jgi:hypothetical protein